LARGEHIFVTRMQREVVVYPNERFKVNSLSAKARRRAVTSAESSFGYYDGIQGGQSVVIDECDRHIPERRAVSHRHHCPMT
jgi:hypothetical protein